MKLNKFDTNIYLRSLYNELILYYTIEEFEFLTQYSDKQLKALLNVLHINTLKPKKERDIYTIVDIKRLLNGN